MKQIKKFPNFNKHLRHFLLLAKLLFAIGLIAHVVLLITGLGINVGGVEISKLASLLIAFVAGSMMVMAAYYRKALGCDSCGSKACDQKA